VTTIHDVVEAMARDHYGKHSQALRWKRWDALSADAIFTVSEQSKRDIVELLGAAPSRVHVTYPGVAAVFAPAPLADLSQIRRDLGLERPFVLYVGHRGEHKNFGLVGSALRDLRLRDLLVVAVGGGAIRADEVARGLAAQGSLIHLPNVDDRTLALLYQAAEAFVFPSTWEGFGLPLVEAMRVGGIVVASDIPTSKELCGNAVRYFESGSADSLAAAIAAVRSPDTRMKLSAGGTERATRYSWRRCAEQTLDVYRSLL
jgi:glycosyltransferase involved in cell wall biosynthesis